MNFEESYVNGVIKTLRLLRDPVSDNFVFQVGGVFGTSNQKPSALRDRETL